MNFDNMNLKQTIQFFNEETRIEFENIRSLSLVITTIESM